MGKVLKVEGYNNLVRDIQSNAIVNTNRSEFKMYMSRTSQRVDQQDTIRNVCREINNLKKELREIKDLIREVVIK
jgi:predicted acetyltransferase